MSRKKHIVVEMKRSLEQRLVELETNECELIQHVRNISQETTCQVKDLLKETDTKKFLKTFPNVSFTLDKSLTALMLMKASLPSLESEDSSEDSDQTTGSQTCETPVLDAKTDESALELEHSADHLSSVAGPSGEGTELTASGAEAGDVGQEGAHSSNKTDTREHLALSDSVSSASCQLLSSPSKQCHSSPASSEAAAGVGAVSVVPSTCGEGAFTLPADTPGDNSAEAKPVQSGALLSTGSPREILPLPLPLAVKIRVVISEVVSPSIFWVQRVESNIKEFMSKIQQYYGSVLKIPRLQPKVGMYCCAQFTEDDCWYRARITAIHLSPSSVMEGLGIDVIYIDYGNRERIPVSRLHPLHPSFMGVPAQAACCSLARKLKSDKDDNIQLAFMSSDLKALHSHESGRIIFVRPTGRGGTNWAQEETDFFTQVTIGRELTAVVVRQVGSGCSGVELPAIDLLFDHFINEKETRLVNVARLMASQHQALPDDCTSYQTAASDPNNSQTTHTTDSELCHSPNATPVASESASVIAQSPESKQTENQPQAREVDQSSGKKKKLKKKNKKARKRKEGNISTEDTDSPMDASQQAAKSASRDDSRKDSTSDTPMYESEYTTEKRAPSFCRTPDTSCTEAESVKEILVAGSSVRTSVQPGRPGVERLPPSPQAGAGLSGKALSVEGGLKEGRKASCGSDSQRSSSPNSTSGVSSAMSLTYLSQKNCKDLSNVDNSGHQKEGGSSSSVNSSQAQCSKRSSEQEKPAPECQAKLSKGRIGASAESDFMTDFFTCTEDVSETESMDHKFQKATARESVVAGGKSARVKEIGKKYVSQESLQIGRDFLFAMSHIVSPGEFYVHLITPNAKKMDHLMDELNTVYTDIERSGSYIVPPSWLCVGVICCAKSGEDSCWYRGIVLALEDDKDAKLGRQVLVKYVDFGNEEWVSEKVVFPLDRCYCLLPPLVFKCAMAKLQPPETREGGDGMPSNQKEVPGSCQRWPKESGKGLASLTGYEKPLLAEVIATSGHAGDCAELEVVDNTQEERLCLNQVLVDLGLASSSFYVKAPTDDHLAGNGKHEQEAEGRTSNPGAEAEIPDDWNPMTQHFSSEANSYGVDMDDAGVATTGQKSTDNQVCKFFAAGKRCFKGMNCPFEHVKGGRGPTDNTQAFWCNATISPPAQGDWVAMEVTSVHSPVHFWVQLPFGPKPLVQVQLEWASDHGRHGAQESREHGETLHALELSINDIYKKNYVRREDLSLLALGEVVCAQFTTDSTWYRARVVDVNAESNTVKVFYVDYGDCEWLPRARVRPAMPQFLHLPFQAIECFLYGVQLAPKPPLHQGGPHPRAATPNQPSASGVGGNSRKLDWTPKGDWTQKTPLPGRGGDQRTLPAGLASDQPPTQPDGTSHTSPERQAAEQILSPGKAADEARKLFEELTIGKALVGHVISSDAEVLWVDLYDTVSPTKIHIADALCEAGYVTLMTDRPGQPRTTSGMRTRLSSQK